jgi:uncharacterized protein
MEIKSVCLSVKPTLQCNAKCVYCLATKPSQNMSEELISDLFAKLAVFAKDNRVNDISINWHGGEPMLMGPGFYRCVMQLQERYIGDLCVQHTMQSNACLYKGETREVLQDMLSSRTIGTCLDPFHRTRLLASGDDYFNESLKGCITLLNDGFNVGMVYVAHKQSLSAVRELYYFFRNLNTSSLLVHPVQGFFHSEYYMSPAEWGAFLRSLWEVWEEDNYHYNVFPLKEWRDFLTVGKPVQSCEYGCPPDGGLHLTVAPDGDLFPCHRFQEKNVFRIGNIRDMSFDDIIAHDYSRLLHDRTSNVPSDCLECAFLRMCRSGCVATHDESGKTGLCAGLRDFFQYLKEHTAGVFQW